MIRLCKRKGCTVFIPSDAEVRATLKALPVSARVPEATQLHAFGFCSDACEARWDVDVQIEILKRSAR